MKRLIALLAALMLTLTACAKKPVPPTSPNATGATQVTEPKEDVYLRDSYSVPKQTAIAHRDKVVATIGDAKLTNGLLQIFYWNGYYGFLSDVGDKLLFYGLDTGRPLDTQKFLDKDGTWQHFFLEKALGNWHNYQLMTLQAQQENIPLAPKYQELIDKIPQSLEEKRAETGFATLDEMIQADAGPAATAADYMVYQELYYRYLNYYDHVINATTFTDEQVDAWFGENETGLASSGITKETIGYDVRHILVKVAEGKTDADWAKCQADAQAILDQWLAGEKTEDSFADLAKEKSQDGGSAPNGGLYSDLTRNTSFAQPFKNWYLDSGRQVGDYGLVKTDYGCHVMYFCGSGTIWQEYCRAVMLNNAVAEKLNGIITDNPPTIDYKSISLGIVNLSK